MGVATGLRSTLVSDEHHAVVLVDCVGYSNGFEFTLSHRSRDPIPRGLLGIEADRQISVRIEYPNGRNNTSHDTSYANNDPSVDATNLHPTGGSPVSIVPERAIEAANGGRVMGW
jgi:hypothetical protein